MLARDRARDHGSSGHRSLPVQHLDRRREDALRLPEPAQVLQEQLPVGRRAEHEELLGEVLKVAAQRVPRDELELAHRVELLDGVVEVIGNRDVLAAAAELRDRPGLHLGRGERGGMVQEQVDRLGHHERREAVGQITLKLEERFLYVRVDRLLGVVHRPAVALLHWLPSKPRPGAAIVLRTNDPSTQKRQTWRPARLPRIVRPMPLEEYRKKRRFDVTPEPAGAKAPKKPGEGPRLRRPEAPGDGPPLRLPAGVERRPPLVGDPEGPVPRPGRQADGVARRGPPARVRGVRGNHPGRRSTAAAR